MNDTDKQKIELEVLRSPVVVGLTGVLRETRDQIKDEIRVGGQVTGSLTDIEEALEDYEARIKVLEEELRAP